MSGAGSPTGVVTGGEGLRVSVVAAQWHEQIMTALLDGAGRGLAAAGVAEVTVVRVPGSFELPVAAVHAARGGADAVVALGVVIRGGTPHFDYVCQAATIGLTDVTTPPAYRSGSGCSPATPSSRRSTERGCLGRARTRASRRLRRRWRRRSRLRPTASSR